MSTAKFDTLSNLAGTQSVPVATVAQGVSRAWVNFNGTGTVAIRASFNVTSITDNGTGNYTVNFTNAMADTNYAAVGAYDNDNYLAGGQLTSHTTTSVVMFNSNSSNSLFDGAFLSVAIFR